MIERKLSETTINKYRLVIDEWFVNGFNGTKAYQKFYLKSKDRSAESNFRKILAITRISEYIDEKRKFLQDSLNISLKRQLYELEELKLRSKDAGRYNESINAIKEQNKLLGYYEKHNEQRAPEVIMSREERDAYIENVNSRIEELLKKRELRDERIK